MAQVRRNVKNVIKQLFFDIPNLRIAIIAHGDYCDANTTYVTKIFDFSTNQNKITDFVTSVESTHGGDSPECYELVLQHARTKLNWQSGTKKILVMIGDDVPHESTYKANVKKIDWRNEVGLINEANINIYGIHCMPGIRRHSKQFYMEISRKTNGLYFTLDQFSSISDLIMGLCYKQKDFELFNNFMQVVENDGRMTRNLKNSFTTLATGKHLDDLDEMLESRSYRVIHPKYSYEEDGLIPVDAGRFQVIYVDEEADIRTFINEQGITFQPGYGFYELVKYKKKVYKIQQYKEILLMDKRSGDLFNGPEVREILGLQPQISGGKGSGIIENLSPKSLDKYRVFIQSTSYNRKLVPGSSLLYEVEDK